EDGPDAADLPAALRLRGQDAGTGPEDEVIAKRDAARDCRHAVGAAAGADGLGDDGRVVLLVAIEEEAPIADPRLAGSAARHAAPGVGPTAGTARPCVGRRNHPFAAPAPRQRHGRGDRHDARQESHPLAHAPSPAGVLRTPRASARREAEIPLPGYNGSVPEDLEVPTWVEVEADPK